MSDEAQRILTAAMLLSAEERAELAAILEDSLGDGRPQAEIDAAWAIEIERRLQAIRSGEMRIIPVEEVDRELDAILARDRRRAAS